MLVLQLSTDLKIKAYSYMTFCTACMYMGLCNDSRFNRKSKLSFGFVSVCILATSAIADHYSILGSFGITINFILQDVHVYVAIQLSIV